MSELPWALARRPLAPARTTFASDRRPRASARARRVIPWRERIRISRAQSPWQKWHGALPCHFWPGSAREIRVRARNRSLQLWQVAEQLERLGIGQGIDVLDRSPVNDVAHRKLGDLTTDRAWDVRYLHDLLGHVMRA